MARCLWYLINERQTKYHGVEWGIPIHDDRKQFEYAKLQPGDVLPHGALLSIPHPNAVFVYDPVDASYV